MNNALRITELLYSCWILSQEPSGNNTVPGRNVHAYALKKAIDDGCFPEWMRKELHFVDGRTGLICLELPTIEELATEAKLTSDPNPSYRRTYLEVGGRVARRSLTLLDIDEHEAKAWGEALRRGAEEAERQMPAQIA